MSGELATVNEQKAVAPTTMVEVASAKSAVLKDIVEKQGLSRNFGGKKNHLDYEAWVTIASLNACTLGVEWSRPIIVGDEVKGFEARAWVRNAEGRELSTAEAECLFTERNWRGKPEFQLRSMAQTRACSKAARMVFSWYAVLAGYAATPAEEMDGATPPPATPTPASDVEIIPEGEIVSDLPSEMDKVAIQKAAIREMLEEMCSVSGKTLSDLIMEFTEFPDKDDPNKMVGGKTQIRYISDRATPVTYRRVTDAYERMKERLNE